MSDVSSEAPRSPWESLWLSPGDAVESILSRGSERGTIALAAGVSALQGLVGIGAPMHALSNLSADGAWAVLLVIIVVSGGLGVATLYAVAYLTNAAARRLGGRGSIAATRAASIWGSTPNLITMAILVIATIAFGGPTTPRPNILLKLLQLVGAIWSLVLVVAMLARIQRFGLWRAFVSWLAGAAAPIMFSVFCIAFVVQPFSVESNSMSPTLTAGDFVFASKWDYRGVFSRAPRRGDVIIFSLPWSKAPFIKRIVGLPGDKIQLIHARLFINGQPVERSPIKPDVIMTDRFGRQTPVATYDEALPDGPTHRIVQLDGDNGSVSNTGIFVTPSDALFVLGDDRDNSNDSRFPLENAGVGFVPIANVVGRARFIYYSFDVDDKNQPPRLGRVGLAVE